VIYIILFFEYVKIGLFSVGGGLATLPFLYQFAANYSDWLHAEDIPDMLAVAQMLPGAIGVNLSAYAGLNVAGIAAGFVAALGLVTPSIIIIIIVAKMLNVFRSNVYVTAVFGGLRPAACGLLVAAGFGIWKLILYNSAAKSFYNILYWKQGVLFVLFFVAVFTLKKHPALYIVLAAALGIILKL
jgi:chromate transporter